jgi:hypothetical protein
VRSCPDCSDVDSPPLRVRSCLSRRGGLLPPPRLYSTTLERRPGLRENRRKASPFRAGIRAVQTSTHPKTTVLPASYRIPSQSRKVSTGSTGAASRRYGRFHARRWQTRWGVRGSDPFVVLTVPLPVTGDGRQRPRKRGGDGIPTLAPFAVAHSADTGRWSPVDGTTRVGSVERTGLDADVRRVAPVVVGRPGVCGATSGGVRNGLASSRAHRPNVVLTNPVLPSGRKLPSGSRRSARRPTGESSRFSAGRMSTSAG